MIKKLKQKKGETLVETLFSLMIAVLCVGLIYSAVMASTNINKQTRALDDKHNAEIKAVEGLLEDAKQSGKKDVVISFSSGAGEISGPIKVSVTVYGKEDSAFLSYDYEGVAP